MNSKLVDMFKLCLERPNHRVHNSHDWIREQIKQLEDEEKDVAHFITINWDSNTHSVEDLQVPLTRVLSKKWMVKYLLAHEQRGEILPDLGTGYHNHILLYGCSKPTSHIHRETYDTCKKYVGNKRHIDVKPVKLAWLKDKEDYLTGKKYDPEKEQKQTMDIIFRKQYGLH